jgi:uracil-DNA glycosylase
MKNIQKSGQRCPKCGKLLIDPMGNSQSPYLLVGEYPGHRETIQRLPFAFRQKPSQTLSGDILKDELARVGFTLNQVLVTNLWQHQQDYQTCDHALHVDTTAKLFVGRTHILLMGSEATEAFAGVKWNEVSGTPVKVPGFSKIKFWASPNPALAYSQPIGEMRLAFQRFAEDARKTK